MLLNSFNLIISIFILNMLNAQNPCLGVSECYNKEICSGNGRCYYDFVNQIFKYNQNKLLTYTTGDITITYYEHCICNLGWTSMSNDVIKCCYEQKSQLTAFLFEFFIGFGSGFFYINRYKQGMIKLFCYLFFCCFCYLVALCIYVKDESKETHIIQKILNSLLILIILTYVIWFFVDVISFGFNLYQDGNGIDLSPW